MSADLLGAPPLTTRRRGTVLVVDDEEGVRASIRAILEETCEVLEAEHGAAERLNLPMSQGVLVVDIATGGPADRAGLRRGDVILEVGRQPVSDARTLSQALGAVPAGEAALLYVHRPGGVGNQFVVLERGAGP